MFVIPRESEVSKIKMIMHDTQGFLEDSWPNKGAVEFKNVKLRYRPTTDLVLKGLSFSIKGGHKIGIVGRTGAGKSTISLALTRIVEIEKGNILIDGLDI